MPKWLHDDAAISLLLAVVLDTFIVFLLMGKMMSIETQDLGIIISFLVYPIRLIEHLFQSSSAFAMVTALIVTTLLYHWAGIYGLLRLRRWLASVVRSKTG